MNTNDLDLIKKAKQSGKKIVFTNGCFDILHVGHARYLQIAKQKGDILVVGLNSDASTRRLKGSSRPIVPEQERRELLLSLKSVDFVIIFDEETPLELIKKVNPNTLIKGGDWSVDKIVGADFVAANGGEIISGIFIDGKSTTNIIEKIHKTKN